MKTPSPTTRFAKIIVTLESRDDGGLRAYSDDVPGFVLSHPNREAVLEDIRPVLETILSAMWGVTVVASPLRSLKQIEDDVDDKVTIPDAHICPKEYVAYAS